MGREAVFWKSFAVNWGRVIARQMQGKKVQSLCGFFFFSFLDSDVVFIDMGIFAECILFLIFKNYLSGIIYLQCYISFECTT